MSRHNDEPRHIERGGLVEETAAKLVVLSGTWPEWYRKMLAVRDVKQVPQHVRDVAAAMKRRRDAGDEAWRDGLSHRGGASARA